MAGSNYQINHNKFHENQALTTRSRCKLKNQYEFTFFKEHQTNLLTF